MFRGRWLILAVILGIGIMWCFGNGYMSWHKDNYACLHHQWWYKDGDKKRSFSAGSLHWFYQPYNFGCPVDERFDPTQYEVRYGEIVPRDNAN